MIPSSGPDTEQECQAMDAWRPFMRCSKAHLVEISFLPQNSKLLCRCWQTGVLIPEIPQNPLEHISVPVDEMSADVTDVQSFSVPFSEAVTCQLS